MLNDFHRVRGGLQWLVRMHDVNGLTARTVNWIMFGFLRAIAETSIDRPDERCPATTYGQSRSELRHLDVRRMAHGPERTYRVTDRRVPST